MLLACGGASKGWEAAGGRLLRLESRLALLTGTLFNTGVALLPQELCTGVVKKRCSGKEKGPHNGKQLPDSWGRLCRM